MCYGNNKRYQLQLNYLSQFLRKYNANNKKCASNNQKINQPTFALNWLSEISHDWSMQLKTVDDDLEHFFNEIKDDLKDSFLFVFSDHGHRFDQIRQSIIGRIEEQMPFFSMHVPQWLIKNNPLLLHILKNNSKVI